MGSVSVVPREGDAELLDGLRQGEAGAFVALMRQNNQRLYRVARGILKDESEAEEAVQDAYLQACAESSWTLRRNAFSGLRFLCLFFYYTDDRTWRSIGYGGTMVDRKLPEAANAREVLDQGARA